MAKVLIKVNVAYPAEFRKTLSAQSANRQSEGGGAYSTGVDEDNHNLVYVIVEWGSVDSAKKFWASPEAQSQIKDWHAVGSPEITILRESPQD